MAKYSIDSTTLTGIADAIREKAKTTGVIATSKMRESILAIKGGLSVDVVTASSLPGTVVDGQIVVITDTTPGTVYIDTDEPTSPATGDVWVMLKAGADVVLALSEESPYLRSGLKQASQWDGSTWMTRDGYLGVAGMWTQFSTEMPPLGSPLNSFTWKQISDIAASGRAAEYFSVGDAKKITINGKVGETAFDNFTVWAFIIGFNHNSGREGNNRIHFQISKDNQTNGKNIGLIDARHDTIVTDPGYFNMNTSLTNSGGWKNSLMRTQILGNDSDIANPLSNSLLAALPSDLRRVMKACTKYSDNTGGGGNNSSYMSATTDYLWLLAEYEVLGYRKISNSGETNYLQQYAYYASGNSKIFYKHSNPTASVDWWLRSVSTSGTGYDFVFIATDGTANGMQPNRTYGITPAFCV